MQAATIRATSSSVSGLMTTNGYSTRQSVASVTCDTRARPSNWMLSRRVLRASRRRDFARSSPSSSNPDSNAATAWRADQAGRRLSGPGASAATAAVAAPLIDLGQAVVPARRSGARRPFGTPDRPAGRGCAAPPRCRPGLRTACGGAAMRRSERNSSQRVQASTPSRRITISRSENDV